MCLLVKKSEGWEKRTNFEDFFDEISNLNKFKIQTVSFQMLGRICYRTKSSFNSVDEK